MHKGRIAGDLALAALVVAVMAVLPSIGVLLAAILLLRPRGILGEPATVSRFVTKSADRERAKDLRRQPGQPPPVP